jgi:SAM-dependent methyltransferase
MIQLLYLRYVVKWFEWQQQRHVKKQFYSNPHYETLDQEVLRSSNPYKIPEAFPYGETPLLVFKQIADLCRLSSKDVVYELGCGRGRGAFFLNHYTGCQVRGIDKVAAFTTCAEQLAKQFGVSGVSFTCADMRDVDFSGATCIYLYGTCLDEPSIEILRAKFLGLPPGTVVITVSYPIEGLVITRQISVRFPWGVGECFIQKIS